MAGKKKRGVAQALPAGVEADVARVALLNAILNLDDEGFDSIAWMVYQQSRTAGGFRDHAGWLRVREAAERLPAVAALQGRFDEAAQRADAEPPTRVVPPGKGGGGA